MNAAELAAQLRATSEADAALRLARLLKGAKT